MSVYEVVVFDVDGYTYVQSFPTKIAAVMRERLNLDVADHDRKIAAEALRDAAWQNVPGELSKQGRRLVEEWLTTRADRIEKGDAND